IDALYIGNNSAGRLIGQEHVAGVISDQLGINIPSTRIENACSSGSVALRQAFYAIKSGVFERALVLGIEKMTDVPPSITIEMLMTGNDSMWEGLFGLTPPAAYALIARAHMHRYGTTKEQLSMVAVKNHKNGSKNPYAQFQREISLNEALNAPMVADPLNLFDCSPITDGAAAIILTAGEVAKKYTDAPVYIIGTGQASDALTVCGKNDLTRMDAVIKSSQMAYSMAGVEPSDIDLAEVHDCFTIAEIIAIEDLGFVKKGEGGRAIKEGVTEIGGKIPINPSGGLKARGHPIGATGVAQAIEIFWQLRQEAGKRQVGNAEIGLSENHGGIGATGSTTIYSLKPK
ncbi:MAG: thiolase domain-containing protein, partial [Candidatus Bathyarchaeia archaeon]